MSKQRPIFSGVKCAGKIIIADVDIIPILPAYFPSRIIGPLALIMPQVIGAAIKFVFCCESLGPCVVDIDFHFVVWLVLFFVFDFNVGDVVRVKRHVGSVFRLRFKVFEKVKNLYGFSVDRTTLFPLLLIFLGVLAGEDATGSECSVGGWNEF